MARLASVELENKNRFWSKRKTDPLSKKGWGKINYKENHFIKRNVLRRHSSLKVVPALGLLRASQALTSGVEGLLCSAQEIYWKAILHFNLGSQNINSSLPILRLLSPVSLSPIFKRAIMDI